MNKDKKYYNMISRSVDFLLVAFVTFLTVLTLLIMMACTDSNSKQIESSGETIHQVNGGKLIPN